MIPEEAIEWLKDYVPKLAGVLSEDVTSKVSSVIRESMLTGSTLQERMKALRESSEVLQRMTDARIESIARTEITRADTMGRLISMKSNDDVIGVEFSAIMDDRTTEICSERHGLFMRLDDPRLPENTPPLHVRCRSMLLPCTVYDFPDGLLTSHEFEDVAAGNQRDYDIEEVRKILDADYMTVSGAISGALNDYNDPYQKRRDAHAERYYEELRRSKPEYIVKKLSEHSGISVKSAQKVYEHVFINEYELDDGEIKRFAPSYDMAESFRRLLSGEDIQEHDIILVHHERLEYELMNRYKKDSRTAHKLTCRKYDYQSALYIWIEERKKHGRY